MKRVSEKVDQSNVIKKNEIHTLGSITLMCDFYVLDRRDSNFCLLWTGVTIAIIQDDLL